MPTCAPSYTRRPAGSRDNLKDSGSRGQAAGRRVCSGQAAGRRVCSGQAAAGRRVCRAVA